MTSQSLSRRELLERSGALGSLWLTGAVRARWLEATTTGKVVDSRAWGRLEELAEGVWAVVSTPMESDDWTTGCNGGLIGGRERVLAVESFVRPAGATWLAEQARQLTGRWPTDVLITHFHGDHANGLEGYADSESPVVWMTAKTRDLIRQSDSQRESPATELRLEMLGSVRLLDATSPTPLDLGGRLVRLHPRAGHTPSDVTAELDDPSIVFCGDLIWNGLFPNYRDTLPTAFANGIRSLRRQRPTTYVSGHGALSDGADVDTLAVIVDHLGEAAQQAFERGISAAEGAAEYRLPAAATDWTLFNPGYIEVAFKAWYRELGD